MGRVVGRVRLALLLATTTLALSLGSAHAQSADDKRARVLFKEGDQAYAEGDYETAVSSFEQAYELSGRKVMLFNLGNALERLGKLQKAADTLAEYLPHAKPHERATLEKRIANLRQRAEAEARVEEEYIAEKQPPATPPAPTRPPDVEEEPRSNTLAYVLLGGGTVAVAAGTFFGLSALSARSDADEGCRDSAAGRLCSSSAEDAVSRDRTYSVLADVSFVLGAAGLGVGAYLLFKEPPATESRALKPRLQARTRPGGAEVSIGARF